MENKQLQFVDRSSMGDFLSHGHRLAPDDIMTYYGFLFIYLLILHL